jgi:hypothetical protein
MRLQTGSTLWIIAAMTLAHSPDVLFVVGVAYIEGSCAPASNANSVWARLARAVGGRSLN